jgi:hypothetical protein
MMRKVAWQRLCKPRAWSRLSVVENGVNDVAQAIRSQRLHVPKHAGLGASAHDRDCCRDFSHGC